MGWLLRVGRGRCGVGRGWSRLSHLARACLSGQHVEQALVLAGPPSPYIFSAECSSAILGLSSHTLWLQPCEGLGWLTACHAEDWGLRRCAWGAAGAARQPGASLQGRRLQFSSSLMMGRWADGLQRRWPGVASFCPGAEWSGGNGPEARRGATAGMSCAACCLAVQFWHTTSWIPYHHSTHRRIL